MDSMNTSTPQGTNVLSSAMSIVGNGMQMGAKLNYGDAQRSAADYEAAQLEQNAGQQAASAQRSAMEDRRQAQIAQSRALAVAAASGGGASDPTVINIISRLSAEGTYRSMSDLYEGREKARQMQEQAAASRYSGQRAQQAARLSAAATAVQEVARRSVSKTAISGASSLYSKYAMQSNPGKLSYDPGAGYGSAANTTYALPADATGWGIE